MSNTKNEGRLLDKTNLGRERRASLNERVLRIRNAGWGGGVPRRAEPADIAKARAKVEAWDEAERERVEQLGNAARVAGEKAYRALLETDNFEVGLQIVRELEAKANRFGWIKDEA